MQAVGVEPESRLAEYGRSQFGVDIRHGLLQDIDLPRAGFDLIYCEQVLEHIENPAGFLLQLKGLLAPGACLYVGVPPVFPLNRLSSMIIRKRGANPCGLPIGDAALTNIFHDPDEHINVFTRRSLQYLADHSGMQLDKLPLTLSTLTVRRIIKQLLTLGSSPGSFLLTLKSGT